MANKYYHPDSDYFREVLGVTPPSATAHITDEEITKNMRQLLPNSWHLEGNQLIGQTEMGRLVQSIPTNYICEGTDDKGLPILTKIKL